MSGIVMEFCGEQSSYQRHFAKYFGNGSIAYLYAYDSKCCVNFKVLNFKVLNFKVLLKQ